MARSVFDNGQIQFEYPSAWELDLAEDDQRTTISLQSADDPAFAMITLDDNPDGTMDPQSLADEALDAMRAEYPDLDLVSVEEQVAAAALAVGYDLEFLSLDMPSACRIRSFRLADRVVLVFAQWSDLDEADTAVHIDRLITSLRLSNQATEQGGRG